MVRLRRAEMGVARAETRIAALPPKVADAFYGSPEWRALRMACLARDGFRCVKCGERAVVADHIVSRRLGGTDALENLRSLCRGCDNAAKEGVSGERPSPGGKGV